MKRIIGCLVGIMLFTGCSSENDTLVISCAASLKDAMGEIEAEYESEYNTDIDINYGGSGALANQIEAGAPADVFFSAGVSQMEGLVDAGLVYDDEYENVLRNSIVFITADENLGDVSLETAERIGIGDPATVPAGQYGTEVIAYYNLVDEVADKLVYGKDVSEVRVWTETNNVDLGIVYKTDALVGTGISIVAEAPEESHSPIIYPAGIMKDSENIKGSEEFMEFLQGDFAQNVFEEYGFTIYE